MFEKFADPNLIHQMSLSYKISMALFVTVLGMLITFGALILLWIVTVIYSKIVRNSKKKPNAVNAPKRRAVSFKKLERVVDRVDDDDEELVAVITAAIVASTGRMPHNFVVKQIRQVVDLTPTWGVTGRINQINGRLARRTYENL